MAEHDFSRMNISFSGCGFMCIYHTGVCAALKEYAPQLIRNRIYGASAGAIAAAALLCNVCISEATSAILQVICEARSGYLQALSPTFDLLGLVRDGMERMLPDDCHIFCTGRLFISLTRYEDCKNVVISEFASKEELIQAVLCSCYIPIFCGFEVPLFRGVRYIDGGFSDNQPTFDKSTITISPFSGESDICPMDNTSGGLIGAVFQNTSFRFTTSNLYRLCSCFAPPSQDICSQFCRQGFSDALRFLTKNSLTPCVKCLTIQSNSLALPVYGANRNFRRRLESECCVCEEKLDTSFVDPEATTALFPRHMQKSLDGTKPRNIDLIDYLCLFRVVRWSASMVAPILTPIDYFFVFVRLLKLWRNSTSKTDFFIERLQTMVDMILKEIEERNLICTPKFDSLKPNLYSSAQQQPSRKVVRESAQLYGADDHMEHSAYVEGVDSVLSLIEYTKSHNAVMAYYYLDNSNTIQVCEIFDVNNPDKSPTCHSTVVTPATQSVSYKTATKTTNNSGGNMLNDPKMVLREEEEEDSNKTDSSTGNLERPQKRRSPVKVGMGERRQERQLDDVFNEDDSSMQNVPPDPDSSSTGNIGGYASPTLASKIPVKKRDACCSPVRHFGKAVNPSASLYGSRASLRTPSSISLSQPRPVRRHNTIGALSSTTAWSGGLRKPSNESTFALPGRLARKASRPQSSSDSDVEPDEKLFVYSKQHSNETATSDGYDGELDT